MAAERRAAPGERDVEDRVGVVRSGGPRPLTFLIVAHIDEYKVRFGVAPICRALTEYKMPIAPSTYYGLRAGQVTQADWDDGHDANRLLDLWRGTGLSMGSTSCTPRHTPLP